MTAFPYVWVWGQREHWEFKVKDGRVVELRPPRVFDRCRKGERCRVIARGKMNSCVIEFESDGYRVCTSRSGLRRTEGRISA